MMCDLGGVYNACGTPNCPHFDCHHAHCVQSMFAHKIRNMLLHRPLVA